MLHSIHYHRCPSYLASAVSTVANQSTRLGLHLAKTARYLIPRGGTLGERAFSYSGPAAWNQLPQRLHNISNFAIFRKHLKAYFFIRCCQWQCNERLDSPVKCALQVFDVMCDVMWCDRFSCWRYGTPSSTSITAVHSRWWWNRVKINRQRTSTAEWLRSVS